MIKIFEKRLIYGLKIKRNVSFKFGDIKDWNISNITNMSYLFYYRRKFNEDKPMGCQSSQRYELDVL